jgi:hypothetical protein
MTIKSIITVLMAILFHFPYSKGSTMISTKAKEVIKSIETRQILNMLCKEISLKQRCITVPELYKEEEVHEQKYLTGTLKTQRGSAHEQKCLTDT